LVLGPDRGLANTIYHRISGESVRFAVEPASGIELAGDQALKVVSTVDLLSTDLSSNYRPTVPGLPVDRL
jgi:hypothetical protein